MIYSLENAESDAVSMLENEDIDLISFKDFNPMCVHDRNLAIHIHTAFKLGRYLKFANEALDVEVSSLRNSIDCSLCKSSIPEIGAATSKVLNIDLPVTIRVDDLNDEILDNSKNSIIDSSLKQLQRDVQRDKYLINGNLIVGAETSLENIFRILSQYIDQIFFECELIPINDDLKRQLSVLLLQKASRTNSGAISYSAVQSKLKEQSIMNALIVPESTLVPPLKLRIRIGHFHDINTGRKHWGLKLSYECTSFFNIRQVFDDFGNLQSSESSGSGTNNTSTIIKAIYDSEINLPLSMQKKFNALLMINSCSQPSGFVHLYSHL
jgi:hypothetical protein